jgi:hypothetical protein
MKVSGQNGVAELWRQGPVPCQNLNQNQELHAIPALTGIRCRNLDSRQRGNDGINKPGVYDASQAVTAQQSDYLRREFDSVYRIFVCGRSLL